MAAVDWERIRAADIERLSSASGMRELEGLYEMLVGASAEQSHAAAADPSDWTKLLRVAQLIMETKDRMWMACERARKQEVERLEAELERAFEEAATGGKGGDDANGGVGGGASSAAAFHEEEMRQLRTENAALMREARVAAAEMARLKASCDAAASERKRAADEAALAAKAMRALEEELDGSRLELRELRAQAATQQSRLASTMREDQNARTLAERTKADADRLAARSATLAAANAELGDEVTALREELAAMAVASDAAAKAHREAVDAAELAKQQLAEAEADKAELVATVRTLKAKLRDAEASSEAFFAEASEKLAACKSAIDERNRALAERDREIQRLRRGKAAVSASGEVQAALRAKTERVAQLEKQVSEFASTVEALNKELDALEGRTRAERESHARELAHTAKTEGGRLREMEEQLRENSEQMRRYDAEMERCAREHAEFVELRLKLKRWEAGVSGLDEAHEEIRALRAAKAAQDEDMAHLVEDLNKHMRAVDDVREENDALREKLGMPAGAAVDTAGVRMRSRLELEQLRALNEQYKAEIASLEDERAKTRAQLRSQALENAERAVRLGLTAADVSKLEAYADRLREGKETSLQEKSRGQLIEEIHELRALLERSENSLTLAQIDKEELADELKRALAAAPSSTLSGTTGSRMASTLVSRSLLEENRRLKELITQSVAQQAHASTAPDGRTSSRAPAEPSMKLVEELESQKRTLQSDLDARSAELSRAQFECAQKETRIRNLERQLSFRQRIKDAGLSLPESLVRGGSAEEAISLLNEQLVECLGQLEQETAKELALERKLTTLVERFESAHHKLEQMSEEHKAARSAWEEERERLSERLNKANEHVLQAKATEEACNEALRARAGDPAAELASCKIRAEILARQRDSLEMQANTLKRKLAQAQKHSSASEQAMSEKCATLEASLTEARATSKRLQDELDLSVPKSTHEELRAKYTALFQLHSEALAAESERLSWCTSETPSQECKLKQRLDQAEAQLRASQERALRLQAALDSVSAKGGDAQKKLAEMGTKIADLSVAYSSSSHLAEIAKQQAQSSLAVQAQLEARVKVAEKQLIEAARQHRADVEEKAALRAEHTNCLPASKSDALQRKCFELEQQVAVLTSEVSKHRELTSISVEQAARLRARATANSTETESLRAAITVLQSKSDSASQIAALEQRLVALQTSEIELRQKADEQSGRARRLAQINRKQQLEERVREETARTEAMRGSYRRAMQELYALADRSRAADEVALERTQAIVARMNRLRGECSSAEDEISALRSRNALLESQLSVSSELSPSGASQQQQQQQQTKLEATALRRQVEAGKERERRLAEAISEQEESLRRLEEQAANDLELWERRYREALARVKDLEEAAVASGGGGEQKPRETPPQQTQPIDPADFARLRRELGDADIAIADRDARIKELLVRTARLESIAAEAEASKLHATRQQKGENASGALEVAQETIASLQALLQKRDESIEKLRRSLAEARAQHSQEKHDLEAQIAALSDHTPEQSAKTLQSMRDQLSAAAATASDATAGSLGAGEDPSVPMSEVRRMLSEKEERVRRAEAAMEEWRSATAASKAQLETALEDAKTELAEREAELQRLRTDATRLESDLQNQGKLLKKTLEEAEALRQQLTLEKAKVLLLSEKTPPASPKPHDAAGKQRGLLHRASTLSVAASASVSTPGGSSSNKEKLLRAQAATKDKKIKALEETIEDLRKQLVQQAEEAALRGGRSTADGSNAERLATALAAVESLKAELAKEKTARQKAAEAREKLLEKLEQSQQETAKQATASQRQRAELERASKELLDVRARITRMQAELAEAKAKAADAEAKLKQQDEGLGQKLRALQQQLATLAKAKDALQQKLAAKAAQADEASAALEQTTSELAKAREQNARQQKEKNARISELEAKCRILESKLAQAQQKQEEEPMPTTREEEMEAQLEQLRALKAAADATITELQFDKEAAQLQAQQLQERLAEAEEQRRKAAQQKPPQKQQQLEGTISQLNATIEKLRAENVALKKGRPPTPGGEGDPGALAKRASEAYAQAETLRKVVQQRDAELAAKDEKLRDLQDRLNRQLAAERDATKLAEEHARLQKENAEMRKELDSLDPTFFAEIARLRDGYRELVRKNQVLEERLRRTQQSASTSQPSPGAVSPKRRT